MTENEELQGQPGEEIRLPDMTYKPGCNKLDCFNWLKDLPDSVIENEIVEIRFKNTRKGFFRNINHLRLDIGDIVAVEASPGHDIGRIAMTGALVREQLKELKVCPPLDDMKKVYRKAKPADILKWEEAKKLENPTMLRSRKISEELKLNMKIGDVEYQGDKTKAIFYYIADERVDFRQLIKVLADEFKVRIEMRQIGARQEAGRIGGIGSCGRELCCSTYITNFQSVTTTHANTRSFHLILRNWPDSAASLSAALILKSTAMLMHRDHSLQERFLWKQQTLQPISRKWRFTREFTGIQPMLILQLTLWQYLFRESGKYRL